MHKFYWNNDEEEKGRSRTWSNRSRPRGQIDQTTIRGRGQTPRGRGQISFNIGVNSSSINESATSKVKGSKDNEGEDVEVGEKLEIGDAKIGLPPRPPARRRSRGRRHMTSVKQNNLDAHNNCTEKESSAKMNKNDNYWSYAKRHLFKVMNSEKLESLVARLSSSSPSHSLLDASKRRCSRLVASQSLFHFDNLARNNGDDDHSIALSENGVLTGPRPLRPSPSQSSLGSDPRTLMTSSWSSRSRSVDRFSNQRRHQSTSSMTSFEDYTGPFVGRVRARVNYTPTPYDRNALRLEKGDLIDLIAMSPSGLWTGRCRGQVGTFKFIHVENVVNEESNDNHILAEQVGNVETLLQKLGLEDLTSLFVLNGFDELSKFASLNALELDHLAIDDPLVRSKILRATKSINSRNERAPNFQRHNLTRDSGCYPHLNTSNSSIASSDELKHNDNSSSSNERSPNEISTNESNSSSEDEDTLTSLSPIRTIV